MSQVIFRYNKAGDCQCLNCKAHKSKTDNCQCFNCIQHRSKDKDSQIPPVGGYTSYSAPPIQTDVVVEEKETRSGWRTFWLIFIVIIFVIIICSLLSYTTSYAYTSYDKQYKEVITETTSQNGTKTYYIYKNNEGTGWGWFLFWVFIFLIVFSPSYYYVK